MPNGNKGEGEGRPIYNRGPSDVEVPQPIKTGGPPPPPPEDRPLVIALHDLTQKFADFRLEIHEEIRSLKRRINQLEEK